MSRDIPAQLLSQWVQTAEPGEVEAELGDIQLIPVESSNLAAVGYDPNRFELFIAFLDGSLYRYDGVPPEEYRGLMTAWDSHGSYFYNEIRLNYEFERIAG